jgi:hypothetical protein
MHDAALLTTELQEPEKMAITVSNEVASPQVEAVYLPPFPFVLYHTPKAFLVNRW